MGVFGPRLELQGRLKYEVQLDRARGYGEQRRPHHDERDKDETGEREDQEINDRNEAGRGK